MKIQLKKGLTINKESISKLQESQMLHVKGGNELVTYNKNSCKSCRHHTCNTKELAELQNY